MRADQHARFGDSTFAVRRRHGTRDRISLTLRIDTQAEIDYVQRGGILNGGGSS
jgi:aconitase A